MSISRLVQAVRKNAGVLRLFTVRKEPCTRWICDSSHRAAIASTTSLDCAQETMVGDSPARLNDPLISNSSLVWGSMARLIRILQLVISVRQLNDRIVRGNRVFLCAGLGDNHFHPGSQYYVELKIAACNSSLEPSTVCLKY